MKWAHRYARDTDAACRDLCLLFASELSPMPRRDRGSSQGSWSSGSSSTAGSSRSSVFGRPPIKIILLPAELSRLLAQPGARLLPDINDYDDPLWIFKRESEYEQNWNYWDVAYNGPRTGQGDRWVIRRQVRWWGCYTDSPPEYTDRFLEPIRILAAVDPEPVFVWN